jgi:maleate isomerase
MWRPELPAQINARIGAATSLPSFTTADAVLAALRALEAKNVVLLTPYPQVTNDHERELLARNGMRVVRDRAMNLKGAHAYAAVEPAAWRDAAVALRGDDVDAYFISCTATRSAEAIDAIETALERPAITSNQAMLWFALRSAGIEDKIDGFGRLLRAL